MSFPRYPAYKHSGVEWLGEVPEHWELSRLGFESWVRARLGWKGLKAEEYVDSGFAFLSTPNIKGRLIDFSNVNYIDIDRYDESPEIKLSSGDVLLAKDGSTLGIANVVRTLPVSATVNSSIAVITPCAKLDSIYLYYLLCGSGMQQLIQQKKGGMGVPHLFQSDLVKFAIPIPASNEQCAIATFLDRETAKIDALIAEQQRLIELLQEKRQAVISHAVTKGLNPDAPMKDSGVEWLGEVPEHWEVLSIKYTCSLLRDGTHLPPARVAEGIPLLSVRNIQGHVFRLRDDDSLISEQDYSELSRSFVPEPDDVMLAIVGATIGKAAIVPSGIGRFHIQRSLAIFRSKPELLVAKWLLRVFGSFGFISLLWQNVGFSAQPGIYLGVLKDIRIPVPPKKEQEEILARLEKSINDQSQILSVAFHSVDLLQERRSALISAAVTGQIDVRGLVPEADTA